MNRKALSLPILISLVVGNVIGTGIYVLPAALAEFGTISLLSWVYTSIGAILLALTFAHLNKRYPKTGGPYAYCKEAFGRLPGFVTAYVYWISNLVSVAGLAVSSIGYLGFLSPVLNANSPLYNSLDVLAIEIAIVWLFTGVNLIGIHTAGVVQVFLTIIKISPLLLVAFVGLGSVHLSYITNFTTGGIPPFTAISSAAAITFWAFIGLETATVPAENTEGAADIYKATVYGTLIASFIYILSTFTLMGMIPLENLRTSQFPFAEAGTMLFGAGAAFIIAICAFVSGLGAVNASILVQGQIVFAAARDGLFPHRFAKLSKHDVPVAAQLLSSSFVTALLIFTVEPTLLKQFNNIALLAALLTLIVYLAATISEMKFLLMSRLSLLRVLFSKSAIIAMLAAAYACWMISSFNAKIILLAIVLILLCIPVYLLTVKKEIRDI